MQRPQPALPIVTIAAVICTLGVSMMATFPAQAGDVQVGRYSTLPARPSEEQSHLLAAMTTIEFTNRTKTVGAALRELLHGSGYRLATLSVITSGNDPIEIPLIAADDVNQLGLLGRLGAAFQYIVFGGSG